MNKDYLCIFTPSFRLDEWNQAILLFKGNRQGPWKWFLGSHLNHVVVWVNSTKLPDLWVKLEVTPTGVTIKLSQVAMPPVDKFKWETKIVLESTAFPERRPYHLYWCMGCHNVVAHLLGLRVGWSLTPKQFLKKLFKPKRRSEFRIVEVEERYVGIN